MWALEQQILVNAVTAYTDVIRDTLTVEHSRNNVQVLGRQLEASQDRFRVGEITRTDVAQAQARLSAGQSTLSRSQATLAESRARYEVVIGQAPSGLEREPQKPTLPNSLEQAISIGLDSNPSLISIKENEEAAKRSVAVAKGGLLPSVDLTAQLRSSEETARSNTQAATYTVGAQATMPIFQGGAQYSRIRQAKHTYSQARIQVAETRRGVIQSVTTAWENIIAARASIVSGREQVRANEIAFDGVQQEAQVGSRTTLDVLDAKQELLDAQISLAGSLRDEYVTAYQLLSAVGKLTAQDLDLPVELYDPVSNYRAISHKWFGYDTTDD